MALPTPQSAEKPICAKMPDANNPKLLKLKGYAKSCSCAATARLTRTRWTLADACEIESFAEAKG